MRDIYAQHVDEHGLFYWVRQGRPIVQQPALQSGPQAMADGEGGFVVAWHDSRNSPLPEIYAQRVNAEGTPLWGTGGVAVAVDLCWQTNPRLVMNSEGNIIISFYNELNFHDTMKAQKLSLSGEVLWPTNGVLVSSYGGGIAEVTADQRGGCILV